MRTVRSRIILVLIVFLTSIGAATIGTQQSAQAVGNFDNATIAGKALTYVGQWGGTACAQAQKPGDSGGQCRAFVNCIVWMASGHSQNLGGSDYFQPFLSAGGQEITDMNALTTGDIVQVGQGIHTFIIVGRVSGNTFNVVDSNYAGNEIVMNYNRTFTLSSSTRAFRMGTVSQAGGGQPQPSLEDVYAINRQDIGSNRTAMHIVNGSNWGQYLMNTATGLPRTDANWDYEVGDLNGDGVLDLWGFNRNPGGGNTVLHVLNGNNPQQWIQAGNIALPGTDANWDFELGFFNGDNVPDIFGINRNPGGGHTVIHVINGANWGQYFQAGNIALPGTDANWDFELGKFDSDGMSDIFGINRNPGGGHTVVHVIRGDNWGVYHQAGEIALPGTDSTWDFELGRYNSDGMPDFYAVNRYPGGGHTVLHVINGANWGQWLQAGEIALPGTDSSWGFAVGHRN